MPAELPSQHGLCWDCAAQSSQGADSAGASDISDSNAVIVTLVQVQDITRVSWIVHQQVVSCMQYSTYRSPAILLLA